MIWWRVRENVRKIYFWIHLATSFSAFCILSEIISLNFVLTSISLNFCLEFQNPLLSRISIVIHDPQLAKADDVFHLLKTESKSLKQHKNHKQSIQEYEIIFEKTKPKKSCQLADSTTLGGYWHTFEKKT